MKKLKVNRSIYSDKTIKAAIQAYKNLACITAKIEDNYILLTFYKCKYGEELTTKEFENYLIGIENS